MGSVNGSLDWRLYEAAPPLTEALEQFAPPQVQELFDRLGFGTALVREPDYFWSRARAKLHNFLGVLPAFLPAPLQFRYFDEDLLKRQAARLYDTEMAYHCGLHEYVLLGFVSPRAFESSPVVVPLDCWDGDFDWDKHTLKHGSLSFEGLRLAKLSDAPPDLAAEWRRTMKNAPSTTEQHSSPRVTIDKKKTGPKSAQGPVCNATDQLFPLLEFRTAPQKVQLEMVLKLIRGKDTELDSILSKAKDKTLKAHIARRMRELTDQADRRNDNGAGPVD